MWLNWSVATINVTLQLLDIYRLGYGMQFTNFVTHMGCQVQVEKRQNSIRLIL